MIDLSFIWLGSSIGGYCIRLLLTDFIKNETSARKDESGQKLRFLNMDWRSIIPVILSL